MRRIAVLSRLLIVSHALVALVVSPATAAMLVFDCISQPNSKSCTLSGTHLSVEVLDAGGGHVAFVFANEDAGTSIVEQIYVEDGRGSLVGPPEILNNEPTVIFQRLSGRLQLTGGAVAQPPFESTSDLTVAAAKPSHELGINPGESLGLLFAIAPGRTIADVLDDLSTGHLRFGVATLAVSGGDRGSLVSQALASDVP